MGSCWLASEKACNYFVSRKSGDTIEDISRKEAEIYECPFLSKVCMVGSTNRLLSSELNGGKLFVPFYRTIDYCRDASFGNFAIPLIYDLKKSSFRYAEYAISFNRQKSPGEFAGLYHPAAKGGCSTNLFTSTSHVALYLPKLEHIYISVSIERTSRIPKINIPIAFCLPIQQKLIQ